MNDFLTLALALVAGVLLGAIFFGGLWWTVQKGISSQHTAPWFLGSLLLRTGIILAGLYFVSDDQWDRLLAGFLGFIIARFIARRFIGPPVEHDGAPANEVGRAP